VKTTNRRAAGFYLQAAAIVLGVIALIVYLVYAAALGSIDLRVVVGVLLGCLCGVLQLWDKSSIPALAMTVLYSVTTFYFITCTETIGSYADYFSNIVAFGHPELIGQINTTVAMLLIAALVSVVGGFLPTKKAS
jgi:hypothetical protein